MLRARAKDFVSPGTYKLLEKGALIRVWLSIFPLLSLSIHFTVSLDIEMSADSLNKKAKVVVSLFSLN